MDSKPAPEPAFGRLLLALVGSIAAIGLVVGIPADESGRVVEAQIRDGAIAVTHVSGPKYLDSYRDIAGIWTICDGDTKGVSRHTRETDDGCLTRLERQLVEHAKGVLACVPQLNAPGRDYQRLAAVSLAYNIGVAGFCGSTVARRFRVGDFRGGCDAFRLWNKAGRPLLPVRGLILRRERERAICLKGIAA